MTPEEIRAFLTMCLSLAQERDREALLSNILDTAMDLAHCDAGTLYLLEEDGLHFCRMVTRSLNIRQGGHADPISLPPVPMDPIYVCAWVALNDETINVADVRTDKHFDFSGSQRYDQLTGYRTKSMLVVPMSNDKGELVGVTQLINALDEHGETIPFPAQSELLVRAISAQAAISMTNMQYSEQITHLLDSLVGALSTAIDQRTPYNANHTRNMVRYGSKFLDWLDASGNEWRFTPEKRRTFLLAVWLHDVGKLVVPLEVMDKETRLGSGLNEVLQRLRVIGLLDRIAFLEGKLSAQEREALDSAREAAAELICRVDRAGFLPDEDLSKIQELGKKTYVDEQGQEQLWLMPDELEKLSIRKGTLTAGERSIMESHVVVTARILSQVSFPKIYAEVPKWAAAHHEYLNGKGYPDHVTAEQIPPEVRLLTILDVFDALTARDRPYKAPMSAEKALGILESMVEEGSIDKDILALFAESKAWEVEE